MECSRAVHFTAFHLHLSFLKMNSDNRTAPEHTFWTPLLLYSEITVCWWFRVHNPDYQAFVKEEIQTADFLFCFMVKGFVFFFFFFLFSKQVEGTE